MLATPQSGAPHIATLLVVDDTPENLVVLAELLTPSYRVLVANTGPRALYLAQSEPQPDLILLDVMMPDMDGYAVLRRLRENPATADVPVIFVTAMTAMEDEQFGFDLGAVDYITKPVRPSIVLARVKAQLELKEARDWLRNKNEVLEAEVAARLNEILLIQDVSIHALARLAETRDPETGNHIHRTQSYVRALALHLRTHPGYSALLSPEYIDQLAKSAPLHDIGKVGIPDHILLKPGKLTAEEWAIMKTHARLGSEAIEQAERDAVKPVGFLAIAKEIAHWHHEKWDGSGYPDGLAGEAIPIPARLMALADVFDALISRRIYKPPMPYEQAREIIVADRGRHFDPAVVDAFLVVFDEFVDIAQRYSDAGAA
ncbi:MAG: two-component system response regulator [Hydrogenophilales bacterium 28-61-23]|nr:MAG: two-component system response regulator [Hydrogenophilales bacterium 28-61-23]